jgi:hypothetical protein
LDGFWNSYNFHIFRSPLVTIISIFTFRFLLPLKHLGSCIAFLSLWSSASFYPLFSLGPVSPLSLLVLMVQCFLYRPWDPWESLILGPSSRANLKNLLKSIENAYALWVNAIDRNSVDSATVNNIDMDNLLYELKYSFHLL